MLCKCWFRFPELKMCFRQSFRLLQQSMWNNSVCSLKPSAGSWKLRFFPLQSTFPDSSAQSLFNHLTIKERRQRLHLRSDGAWNSLARRANCRELLLSSSSVTLSVSTHTSAACSLNPSVVCISIPPFLPSEGRKTKSEPRTRQTHL